MKYNRENFEELYEDHCFQYINKEIKIKVEKTNENAWKLSVKDLNNELKTYQYFDYTLEEALKKFKKKIFRV